MSMAPAWTAGRATKKDGVESAIATPLKPHHIVPLLFRSRVLAPGAVTAWPRSLHSVNC
jgi:hypothetical protein